MAGNSKDSKILAYKDMINQLNKTISAQTELIQSLQKTLEADRLEKENLRQQIEYLTKKLFGTSSEKRKDIDGQLNLFDEAEQEADPTWKRNFLMTSLFRNISEKHDGHIRISLKMFLPADEIISLSGGGAKLSNLRNAMEMYWESNSSAMNSGLPLPKGK